MESKNIIINVSITLLLAVSIVTFIASWQSENGSDINVADDPRIASLNSSAGSALSSLQSNATQQKDAFDKESNAVLDFGQFVFNSIIGLGRFLVNSLTAGINIIFVPIFGIVVTPSIVQNVISGLIVLIGLLSIWALIRTGR